MTSRHNNTDREPPRAGGSPFTAMIGMVFLLAALILGMIATSNLTEKSGMAHREEPGQDPCAFSVAGEIVLFSAYQPENMRSADRRLCRSVFREDGPVIFVLDIVGDKLRTQELDVFLISSDDSLSDGVETAQAKEIARAKASTATRGTIKLRHDMTDHSDGEYQIVMSVRGDDPKTGRFTFSLTTSSGYEKVVWQGTLIGSIILFIAGLALAWRGRLGSVR